MGWESLVPRYAAAVRSGVGGALGGRLKRWFSASRFSRWTIAARIAAIVLTLAVPLNLIVVAVVWHLADAASEAQRKSLLYTSRSVAAAADAELGKYMALAQSLARSPALLDDNLAPFEAEARRAFASLPDAWVVVADLNGQQLINTASQPGQPLPPSDPACTTAQKRALETGSIVLTDVRMSPVLQDWVVSIDVPIFRDGQPLRALAIVTKAHSFLRLLSDQQIPKNWLAGILDSQGRFIARVPGDARYIGQLAPQGFRKVKDRDGIFEFVSMEGDPIVAANAHSLSGWPVAIAIKKAELQAMTWSTVRWAAILGGGLSVLSLLFACAISRRITGPITELRQKAAALLTGPACPMPPGPPEVRDLWEALRQVATNRHRNEQALRESREDLSRAQAVARIGSWRLDASRNELTWSTEAFHIFGVSPDEPLTYESLLASVHPDDRGHVDRNWKAALAGAPYDLEYRIAAGGKTKWVHARAELELDAAGKLLGGFGTVQDITDMKQAEEELLRQRHLTHMIGDRAADAIFLTDEAGHITYANPEAEGSFGYERREMMGRDLHELLHHHFEGGARYPTDDCVLSRVQEKGAPVRNHEDVFYRKDASPIEVSFSYAPLEQDGKRAGGVFVVRDITAQKAAQAALRESEERFRGIFENAGTGIAIADMQGRFQTCNPAFSAMLGYTAEELRKLSFLEAMHPEDREKNLDEMSRLLSQEIGSFETLNRCVRKSGEALWGHKRVSLARDAAGKPTSIIVLVTNMTEHKRAEEHIRLLMREVNHRSKNMLALVQSVARQTLATNPDDFIARFGERIQALAASQDLLVKNEWKGVDLGEVVRSQLAHFQDLIGTRIDMQGPPVSISASAAQAIGMALHELATNAGKYGALSTDTGDVEMRWSLERDGDGDGEEDFLITWRERGGPPVKVPGRRGFGWTVMCRMIESSLDARVDLGFEVTGLTWRLQCPAGEVLEHNRPAPPSWVAKPPVCNFNFARQSTRSRVLVVEDEPLVAIEIAHVLNGAGFDVVGPAGGVSAALELLNQGGCDAAVLDINLGNETSEPIALELAERRTPFVTVSGYSREQHPPAFNGAPALAKPLRPELLIIELKRCVEQKASTNGGMI